MLLFRSSDEIKVRVKYIKAIWIRFMSNVWLQAHFPQKTLWFGEKSTFLTQKTWFHAISRLVSFPTIFICKKWAKYNYNSYGKIQAKQIWLLKYTKTCPKLAVFGHFLISSFFEVPFLGTWSPNLHFHSSNVGWNTLNDWSMPQVYIKQNFQIWPKGTLSSVQSTVQNFQNFPDFLNF